MNFRKLFIAISNKHDLYYRVFLLTVSVLLIAYVLPRQLRFRYSFKIGQPWSYEDLRAPFSFPVFKSTAELDAERSGIMAQSPRYYRWDSLIALQVIQSIESKTSGDSKELSALLGDAARQAYQRGIIDERHQACPPDSVPLEIIRGGKLMVSTSELHLTTGSLKKFLKSRLATIGDSSADSLAELILPLFRPDLIFDHRLTADILKENLGNVSNVTGEIPEGSIIVRRGQVIDQVVFSQLESLRRIYRGDEAVSRIRPALYTGYLLLVLVAISLLLTFLWLLRKDILLDSRKLTMLILLIVLTCMVYSLSLSSSKVNMMMLPLCMLPLVTRAFFDTRTALFTHVLTMLILGTIAPGGFEFVYMQIIAGMVAIFSIVNMNKRSQLFIAVGLIFSAYLLSYIGLTLINEGKISAEHSQAVVWLMANGLLTLLSYPLIFSIEKIFGVTSDFTLMELTDFNSELLREISLKAPGTFQHSLQVANLAEAAIYKIGGNSLLVRAGALYHDIGKMDMPMYFIENQSTMVNPHDELSFDESASIITSHVIRGIEKAKKHNLPDILIDFIRTHHGTMRVQYFYNSFIKSFPDQVPNDEDFRYPGPKPFSKETAVLMMADSVEAAARSLPVHDADSLEQLVEKIIHHQVDAGQFENCDITYKDITTIKKIFKKMLASIYHVRVAYPS